MLLIYKFQLCSKSLDKCFILKMSNYKKTISKTIYNNLLIIK